MEIILYDRRRRKKILARTVRFAGLSLITVFFLALIVVVVPILIQETNYRFHRVLSAVTKNFSLPSASPSPFKKRSEEVKKEAQKYGVSTDFSIVIPKISAAAKIIPNINPAIEKEYRVALKEGVAHAVGTKFPGQKGTVYLFAHSTNSPENISRYNAVFYLLKELGKNDEIIIFFGGQKYLYRVTERLITAGNDTKWLTDKADQERLVLQTCWPPGTTQKRLLVIALLKK